MKKHLFSGWVTKDEDLADRVTVEILRFKESLKFAKKAWSHVWSQSEILSLVKAISKSRGKNQVYWGMSKLSLKTCQSKFTSNLK